MLNFMRMYRKVKRGILQFVGFMKWTFSDGPIFLGVPEKIAERPPNPAFTSWGWVVSSLFHLFIGFYTCQVVSCIASINSSSLVTIKMDSSSIVAFFFHIVLIIQVLES